MEANRGNPAYSSEAFRSPEGTAQVMAGPVVFPAYANAQAALRTPGRAGRWTLNERRKYMRKVRMDQVMRKVRLRRP
jgi:hypothetical protein